MHRLWFLIFASLTIQCVHAETPTKDRLPPIAIIGTGEVGSALGVSWGHVGYSIIYGSRTPNSDRMRDLLGRSGDARAVLPSEAAKHADIVVLALPFSVALGLLPQLGNLDGKLLIDPMNALEFDDKQRRVGLYDELLAEQIQALAPNAHVVKALNAINAGNMSPNRAFAGPISIPIAGNDPDAKKTVTRLVEALDLSVTDVGPLFNARYLEAMAPLYVYMNFFARPSRTFEYVFSGSEQ